MDLFSFELVSSRASVLFISVKDLVLDIPQIT